MLLTNTKSWLADRPVFLQLNFGWRHQDEAETWQEGPYLELSVYSHLRADLSLVKSGFCQHSLNTVRCLNTLGGIDETIR